MLEAVIWLTIFALAGLWFGVFYYGLTQRLRGLPGYQKVRGYRVAPNGDIKVEY